jgi:hypothetical protein
MRATYLWLSRLIAIGVVLQAAFIAFGTFDILKSADDGKALTADSDYNVGQSLHSIFGNIVIPLLALVLLIVSFFMHSPTAVKLGAAVFGLVVLQVLLAVISFPVPVLGILHGLNAFALAAVAGVAGSRVGRPPTVPAAEATAAA